MEKKWWILRGIKILIIVTLAIFVFGFGTMYLWNWLVPVLFHGPMITFPQTIGLLLLSKIIFGGFHRKGRRFREHAEGHWKAKMEAKWDTMSPDEREKARTAFRNRCGRWGARWQEPGTENKVAE